ncbi:hypothetical protein K3727_13835 [Rhodobacteraceae bacterium M382]|nr:hypothetical protein K3727_13835 [Rhodobacteraceae bacterium M382]
MMIRAPKSNLILGLVMVIFAAILLSLWIPLDTQTGLVEKIRRQVVIGDALAPTVAALFLLIGGGLLVVVDRTADGQPKPSLRGLGFTASLIAVICISLVVMRHAGPLSVWLINTLHGDTLEYRLLRDSAPWKYIGYLLGGTLMISGMIALVEGRIRIRAVLVALLAVLIMIALYDLPFKDLLLPPNGDV